MVPFFLVNSPGGSATKWLANLLNQHPSVMCFHACRRRPGQSEVPILEANDLIDLLIEEKNRNEWCRSIGSVHSYHAAEGYQETRLRGGGILGILRNPIRRMHSLISTHWKDIRKQESVVEDNIYEDIKRNGNLRLFKTREIFDSSDMEERLANISYLTLQGDLSLLKYFKDEELIFFEDMVFDFDYLREIIMNNFMIDISCSEHMFEDKVNTHSYTFFETEEEIIQSWPDEFKVIFLEIAKTKLAELIYLYQKKGYPFGDYVSAMHKSLHAHADRLETVGG